MPTPYSVAVIVGSLRKESFSLKIANALAKLAPDTLKLHIVTLHGISFFNQDLEATPPADWVKFREMLQASSAVLFVTPEYNRAISGVLKNAIDVGSRPYGKSSFNGKAFSSRSMVLRSGRSRALLTCALHPHRQDLRQTLASSQEAQKPDAKSWITGDLKRCRHAHRRSNASTACSDRENRSWNRWARPLFRTSTRQARALNRDKFRSRRSDWAAIIRGLRKDIHPFSQFRGCEEI